MLLARTFTQILCLRRELQYIGTAETTSVRNFSLLAGKHTTDCLAGGVDAVLGMMKCDGWGGKPYLDPQKVYTSH